MAESEFGIAVNEESYLESFRQTGTLTVKRKAIYLKTLAETANTLVAAKAAGYSHTGLITRHRHEDPEFDAACAEAEAAAADILESAAVERAVKGTQEPIYYRGELIGYKTNYSDALLKELLRGAKPKKYGSAEDGPAGSNTSIQIGVAVLPAGSGDAKSWEQETASQQAGLKVKFSQKKA